MSDTNTAASPPISRVWVWVPLILFAGFGALAAFMLTQPKDEFVHSQMIGKPLPEFELRAASADRPGA